MAFSYFDPYYVGLDRQKAQIVLDTSIFQGNLLHQTCIFLETPKQNHSHPENQGEGIPKGTNDEYDDLVFDEPIDMDTNLHALDGTKLVAPLWLIKALILPSIEGAIESSTSMDTLEPTQSVTESYSETSPQSFRSSGTRFARILVPMWYQASYLHRLASPVYSTKHMMHEFASSNLNKEVDDYFYDVGMCLAGLLKSSSERERIINDLHRVYQNRYYFVLRGAYSGIPRIHIRCTREKKLAQGMKASS